MGNRGAAAAASPSWAVLQLLGVSSYNSEQDLLGFLISAWVVNSSCLFLTPFCDRDTSLRPCCSNMSQCCP